MVIMDNSTTGGGGYSQSRWSVNSTGKGSMGVDLADGNKLKISGGLNVNVSTYVVYGSSGTSNCGPNPWVDVTCYGAVGDSVTLNDIAIANALAVIPSSGGILYFPRGVYRVGSSIVITDKLVTFMGDGGVGSWGSSADVYGQASVIKSTETLGPIIKWTTADRTFSNIPNNYWVAMRNIAVQGSGTANAASVNNQHCIQVDQQGLQFDHVSANWCGGHGFYLTSSVSGNYYDIMADKNNGSGIYIDDYTTYAAGSGVTDNNFWGAKTIANAGDGWHFARGGQGTKGWGCLSQSNGGYNWNLSGERYGGLSYIDHVRFIGSWDETSTVGSVHISSNARHLEMEFTQMSDSYTVDAGAYDYNISAMTDNSGKTTPDQNTFFQFGQIVDGSSHDSADVVGTKFVNQNRNGYGRAVAGSIVLANGGNGVFDVGNLIVPSTIPLTGAINIYNGQGITSENAAGNGAYTLIQSNSSNGATLPAITATGNITANGGIVISSTSGGNYSEFAGTGNQNQAIVTNSTQTIALFSTSNRAGLCLIEDSLNGNAATFLAGYQNTINIISQTGSVFVTSGASGKVSLSLPASGSGTILNIYNNTGSTNNFDVTCMTTVK